MKPASELVNPTVTINTVLVPTAHTLKALSGFPVFKNGDFSSRTILSRMYVYVCVCVFMCTGVWEMQHTRGGNNGPSLNGLHSGANQPFPVCCDDELAITSFFRFTFSLSFHFGFFSMTAKVQWQLDIDYWIGMVITYFILKDLEDCGYMDMV